MSGDDGQIKNITESFAPYVSNLKIAGEELLTAEAAPEVAIA
jgi:hypothetical protein